MEFNHFSVLNSEAIEYLNIKPNGVYVDATLGGGGHTKQIVNRLDQGRIICFDQDERAINFNKEQFKDNDKVTIIKDNFSNLKTNLEQRGITKIDGIIFDLGVSSVQIDEQERGFSYRFDARLDMRMDQDQKLDAHFIVNNYEEKELAKIFKMYGEEKFAERIAATIVKTREEKQIETTGELVAIIEQSIPAKFFYKLKSHPAKKVFQALRIEVNKELEVLKTALADSFDLLNTGGRICVISFHSLEDRIAKTMFNELSEVSAEIRSLPVIPEELSPRGRVVTKKPILPSASELEQNTRSKSAKLRVIEKIKE